MTLSLTTFSITSLNATLSTTTIAKNIQNQYAECWIFIVMLGVVRVDAVVLSVVAYFEAIKTFSPFFFLFSRKKINSILKRLDRKK